MPRSTIGQRAFLPVGDILQITPGGDAVSFMWSYPNMLPRFRRMPARTARGGATMAGGYMHSTDDCPAGRSRSD
ncbi:hypothetical protein [uncultured Sphingomonas sp.]|uniref:hypothetical protein n=1 Tax=uncultured Sphingomonas sp. TaxID=158754 RepID=UPI0025FB1AC2|nr:hypothetical protein [uncultured Sphingomonas sp.]